MKLIICIVRPDEDRLSRKKIVSCTLCDILICLRLDTYIFNMIYGKLLLDFGAKFQR